MVELLSAKQINANSLARVENGQSGGDPIQSSTYNVVGKRKLRSKHDKIVRLQQSTTLVLGLEPALAAVVEGSNLNRILVAHSHALLVDADRRRLLVMLMVTVHRRRYVQHRELVEEFGFGGSYQLDRVVEHQMHDDVIRQWVKACT